MAIEFEFREKYGCADLLRIMELLRGEDGCPWDREQTHGSIRRDFLEEAYEAVDAIDNNDTDGLEEELGDVLLQVVFHAQIEKENGGFDFDDVCDGICKKLILRHPHIFGDVTVKDSREVKANWDAIKQKEKGQTTATDRLRSVPKALPGLMRAAKVQGRAAKAGMDFSDLAGTVGNLKSEIAELEEAIKSGSDADKREELGDVLFSAVNAARFLDLDAEECINESTEKFTDRFEKCEKLASEYGVDMKTATQEKLDELWREAKQSGYKN